MFIVLIATVIFGSFMPFVFLAARTAEDDRRMKARFAMLQAGGAGGLSSGQTLDLLRRTDQGAMGWLDAFVMRLSLQLHIPNLLLQAGSEATAKSFLLTCLAAAVSSTVVVLVFVHHVLPASLVGLGAGYTPFLLLKLRRQRRILAMDKVLPDVVDMISRALRAGHSMPAAIGMLAEGAPEPARSAFAEVFQKQKFGFPLRDALLELVARFPSQDLRVLVTAILVQRDTGGNLVQILERTASVIRDRLKLKGDVRVHTAQGRLTGWILCILPVGMLLLLSFTDPGYAKALTEDPLGRKFLYGGGVLLLLGGTLINRIVTKIEV